MTALPEHCLTIEQLAEFLGFEKDRVIRENVRHGVWPHRRFGRKIRFAPEDVEAILRMAAQQPQVPKQQGATRRRSVPAGVDLSVLNLSQRSRAARTTPS